MFRRQELVSSPVNAVKATALGKGAFRMGLWDIDKIEYVGRQGVKEGLGFRYYDKNKVVAGKPMPVYPPSRSMSLGIGLIVSSTGFLCIHSVMG